MRLDHFLATLPSRAQLILNDEIGFAVAMTMIILLKIFDLDDHFEQVFRVNFCVLWTNFIDQISICVLTFGCYLFLPFFQRLEPSWGCHFIYLFIYFIHT